MLLFYLGTSWQCLLSFQMLFCMQTQCKMRRSARAPAPKVWFDQKSTSGKRPTQKKAKKKASPAPKSRPATKAAEPAVNNAQPYQQRDFSPPFAVPFELMRVLWIERDPFSLFVRFLGEASLIAIVDATNAKAAAAMHPHQEFARPWTPLSRGELLYWLGLLFYMANHIEVRRHDYWRDSTSLLTRWMGRNRWEQIHRFLTFNIQSVIDTPPEAPWFWKIEPIYSLVRGNCRAAIIPSSWLSIDECIVPYKGRSSHLVRLPGKPIPEGYKIWALGSYGGYILDWLIHSPMDGPKECLHKRKRLYHLPIPLMPVGISETFQVPVRLFERLHYLFPHRKWVGFLDNLFLNIDVAHILMNLNVGVMGTTRKSSVGFPKQLQDIKDLNRTLLYGDTLPIQCGWALCFA